MDKCYVCKSNRRQLLMLSCSHDVCIKCAADNYFLNTINVKDKKKQQKKQQKKESYFCEICLQVTKIDQNTINQLKQWYIKNVNSKNQSKVASKSKDRNKQQVGRFGEQKVVMKSKPRQQQKTQYKMYHNSKNNFRHQQQRQDEYEQRNYHMMRYDNNNNNIKKNINNDNNIKKNMISNNNKNNQPNSNKFNNNNKKKYIMFEQQQQQKNRNTNQLILDSYYQRFSYNPYQSHYVVNNNNDNDNKNVDINNNNKNVDINNDNNHINNNINNHVNNHINKKRSPPSISQSKQSSQVSKQRQRAFGSITRRDSLSTNNNNVNNNNNKNTNASNNNNKNSYQYQLDNYHNYQQHKRRRIQSYRSQQKCNTVPIQGRIGQRTIRRQKSNYFQEKQQQQQQQITTPRNLLVYAQQKNNNNNNNNSNKKKKQVYLDLIGYQHSLQQSQQQYQQQQQQKQNYPYHIYQNCNKQKEQNSRNHDYRYRSPRTTTTKGNQHNQRKQIINKFNQHQLSLSQASQSYHKYQQQLNNTITTPTSVKSPKTIHKNQYKQNQNNHKLYCNIHQDEKIIYYCLQCKLLICSQCALYKQHKEHNMHTLKKAAFKLKETLYLLISEINSYIIVQQKKQQILLQQIKQLKVQSNKQKQKVKHTFQIFIKNIQNKYAQILQQLQQSQSLSISGFNKQLQITRQRCKQFYQTKASMNKLLQTFSKNQNTNNLLIGEAYSNCDSMKNIIGNCGGSTSASNTNQFGVVDGRGNDNSNIYSNNYNNFNNNSNNRMYRQFDDCFKQNNSITSSQRNYINLNIDELQSKISQYEEYVKKFKPQYQKVIYPTLYVNNKNNFQTLQSNKNINQVKNSKLFFRQRLKSRKQSLQLHESLKLSQTSSLLINQPSQQSPKNNKRIKYDNFIDEQDFIQENILKSLNLIIEKQLVTQQQLKETIKLCHVDTIVESIKQIQEIIKQFRIQQRVYEIKAGRRMG